VVGFCEHCNEHSGSISVRAKLSAWSIWQRLPARVQQLKETASVPGRRDYLWSRGFQGDSFETKETGWRVSFVCNIHTVFREMLTKTERCWKNREYRQGMSRVRNVTADDASPLSIVCQLSSFEK
jgi:hypothetical protein